MRSAPSRIDRTARISLRAISVSNSAASQRIIRRRLGRTTDSRGCQPTPFRDRCAHHRGGRGRVKRILVTHARRVPQLREGDCPSRSRARLPVSLFVKWLRKDERYQTICCRQYDGIRLVPILSGRRVGMVRRRTIRGTRIALCRIARGRSESHPFGGLTPGRRPRTMPRPPAPAVASLGRRSHARQRVRPLQGRYRPVQLAYRRPHGGRWAIPRGAPRRTRSNPGRGPLLAAWLPSVHPARAMGQTVR